MVLSLLTSPVTPTYFVTTCMRKKHPVQDYLKRRQRTHAFFKVSSVNISSAVTAGLLTTACLSDAVKQPEALNCITLLLLSGKCPRQL